MRETDEKILEVMRMLECGVVEKDIDATPWVIRTAKSILKHHAT